MIYCGRSPDALYLKRFIANGIPILYFQHDLEAIMRKARQALLKLFTLTTVLALLFAVSPVGTVVMAEYYTDKSSISFTQAAGEVNYGFPSSIDAEALKQYLIEQLSACAEEINLYSFRIPFNDSTKKLLESMIFYDTPEIFHINGYSTRYYGFSSGNVVASIVPQYAHTADEYAEMYSEMVKSADILVKDIEGNVALTDVEKALLLHDRLAVWCDYDYTYYQTGDDPRNTHTPYGALAERMAVCQGYTMAYSFLLQRVGIVSRYAESQNLGHSWNIVFIDGKGYHVDVTWDDGFIDGEVRHDYFLISSEKLNSFEDHAATDMDMSPTDKTYDNAVWQSSRSATQLINNELYYIDQDTETINRFVSSTQAEQELDIPSSWENWYPNYYARLASDGNELFYTTSSTIYSYNPATGMGKPILTPEDITQSNLLYGLGYEDGYIFYDLHTSPNYFDGSTYTSQYRQYRFEYPTESAPLPSEIKISGTVATAAAVPVTVSVMSSDTEVASVSSDTGSYELGVAAGDYVIIVSADGYVSRKYQVTVSGESVTLDAELWQYGDVNGDGSVSMSDYQSIYNHVTVVSLLSGYPFECADWDNNGTINMSDTQKEYMAVSA